MDECGVSGCGVSSSIDESGMSAAAVHLSDSSGSPRICPCLYRCSSQCLRAKSTRSLSVSIFGFVFFAFNFLFSHTARIFCACLDIGRK